MTAALESKALRSSEILESDPASADEREKRCGYRGPEQSALQEQSYAHRIQSLPGKSR